MAALHSCPQMKGFGTSVWRNARVAGPPWNLTRVGAAFEICARMVGWVRLTLCSGPRSRAGILLRPDGQESRFEPVDENSVLKVALPA